MYIELTFNLVYLYILSACVIGFLYGIFNWIAVMSISVDNKFKDGEEGRTPVKDEEIVQMNLIAEKIQEVINCLSIREPLLSLTKNFYICSSSWFSSPVY